MIKVALLQTCLALGAIAATAQDVQSRPFKLIIQSADKTLNDLQFATCHTGAAIESICLGGNDGATFYFNTTQGSQSPIEGYEPSGVLVWNLVGESFFVSEPMSLYLDPSTNVGLPLLEPGYSNQQVTFDPSGRLAIFSYVDDTKTPPTYDKFRAHRNWFVCKTYYSSYQYTTLAWVVGSGNVRPQNPSCVKVEVYRKFV
ncbi:hypothetical protein CDD81_4292 [Ophiocordyceps australis]|uniref:DUF7907 domain-containing protein n=1 Tax=Ophiocordyceps australis TaxID=1399860 RepID=A0A2C5YA66_9HYPO|nr:hypothetical protein CDD81_4292 [Ophiocordyceps australis]